MKICFKCKCEKDLSEFSKDKTKKDGYNSKCKECGKIYEKLHEEKRKERNKNWSSHNYDKIHTQKTTDIAKSFEYSDQMGNRNKHNKVTKTNV